MDFWDTVSKSMDKLATKLDSITESHRQPENGAEFSVLEKSYCWEDLDYSGEDTLQRHIVIGQCRIVDRSGTVVDVGPQAELEQSMIRRAARYAAERDAALFSGNSANLQPVQAKYGDIIGVVRQHGAYEHYGIYVSDTCVVHYAIPASQTFGHATVHATSLRNFLRDDTEYFVLDFPKPYQPPVRIENQNSAPHTETVPERLARHLQSRFGYHLYTPQETVDRARSRLGETSYNLLTNNCEHFVIWCKTGVRESMQITEMFGSLLDAKDWQFRKPLQF